MNNYFDHAVQTLSTWVRQNTKKGELAPRFPLETGLIMVNDGMRRKGLEDLVLLNYYPTAAFRKASEWKDIERVARGLIFEKGTGRLVARPFVKFFNYGELDEDYNIQDSDIKSVSYKEDGSMGICFFYDGEWWATTHGSLGSDQGVRGTQILRRYNTKLLDTSLTYLVEIVYPENRIVTNYGDMEELLLLEIYPLDTNHTVTQEQRDNAKVVFSVQSPYVDVFKFAEQQDYIQQLVDYCENQQDFNFEGFVVTLNNGRMLKLKTQAYLKVHRCRFDVSVARVKDLLLNNPDTLIQWKETLPNEFFDEVDAIVSDIVKYTDDGLKIVTTAIDKIFIDKDISWNQNLKHVGKIIHVEVKRDIPQYLQDAAWVYSKGTDIQKVYRTIMKTYPV